jgi:hypothetical protein
MAHALVLIAMLGAKAHLCHSWCGRPARAAAEGQSAAPSRHGAPRKRRLEDVRKLFTDSILGIDLGHLA